jgi:hypothetical protein
LLPPQKFEQPQFWNGCSCRITNYDIKVIFNGMTSLLNFIEIYQFIQKLMEGDRHAERKVIS